MGIAKTKIQIRIKAGIPAFFGGIIDSSNFKRDKRRIVELLPFF